MLLHRGQHRWDDASTLLEEAVKHASNAKGWFYDIWRVLSDILDTSTFGIQVLGHVKLSMR